MRSTINIRRGIVSGIVVTGLAATGIITGCSTDSSDDANSNTNTVATENTANETRTTVSQGDLLSGTHHVQLTVDGYDPITIEVNADAAPITATNFINLVNDGYYDGLAFYRIVDGFCLQGGTLGNTASGADPSLDPIDGEFSDNGYDNSLADDFTKGTVAMARTSDPNSATSTFFVTLDDNSSVDASLNGQYAAFGMVDEAGMATIDKIVSDYISNVDDEAMGTISDENQMPIISSITQVD